MTKLKFSRLGTQLLEWYQRYKRDLPWRDSSDPYMIWVSEIMLQQTRVETVVPYFETWMQRFPSLSALAHASQDKVLNAWEGLGYYGRARNLHKAAKIVFNDLGGEIPGNTAALRALPGIGRYTAGAIASIAFGLDEPVLDANIKRVYARLFAIDKAVNTPAGEKILWELASKTIPTGQAGAFNQALMDLGAMICTPTKPDCNHCPIHSFCQSFANGYQDARPVIKRKGMTPHYFQAAAVILEGDRTLLVKRPSKGLLGGMWEFPSVRVAENPEEMPVSALLKAYDLNVRHISRMNAVQHAYTHFKVTVQPFVCELVSSNGQVDLNWVDFDQLNEYPMGKVDRTIAGSLQKFEK